jgi:hypothetical protein
MGLFERLHLPDQDSFDLCGGPSRGLHLCSLLVSIPLLSSGPAARVADHCRSRACLQKSAILSPSAFD